MGRGIQKTGGGNDPDIRDVAKQIPDRIKEMNEDSPNEHDVLNDILEGAGEPASVASIFD